MRLLLTSAGLTNESIVQALRDLVGKPVEEARLVSIPTAHNPVRGDKRWVVEEDMVAPLALPWKQVGIIDLAAVASLERDLWWPELEAADVLLFGGGNVYYLSYWMQQSGIFDALPGWMASKVYLGISAGSQIAGASLRVTSEALARERQLLDDEYGELGPRGQSAADALKLVDFVFRPHLNSPDFPKIRERTMHEAAKALDVPMYAVDDQTAIKITDNAIEVISEGESFLF